MGSMSDVEKAPSTPDSAWEKFTAQRSFDLGALARLLTIKREIRFERMRQEIVRLRARDRTRRGEPL